MCVQGTGCGTVTAAAGTNHLAVAVGYNAPEAPHELTDLGRFEDRDRLVQTAAAIEPIWVVREERLNAISAVHVQIIGASLAMGERHMPDDQGRVE